MKDLRGIRDAGRESGREEMMECRLDWARRARALALEAFKLLEIASSSLPLPVSRRVCLVRRIARTVKCERTCSMR